MLPRLLASLSLLPLAAAPSSAADDSPYLDLRLELGRADAPRHVSEEFTNDSGAAVASGTYDLDLDARRAHALRVLAASSAPGARGGALLWGVGGEWLTDRFHLVDPAPERAGPELRSRLLGAVGMLGWAWSPLPGLELEAAARAALGICHLRWIGPDASAGAVEGEGDGGYASEGLRLAAGTCPWRHAVLQAYGAWSATQAGADVDYDTGDSSRLRIDGTGWEVGVVVGYRF
jgi:hypothetical protein